MPKIVYDDWSEQEFNQEDFISREELSEKYVSKEEVENNYVSKEKYDQKKKQAKEAFKKADIAQRENQEVDKEALEKNLRDEITFSAKNGFDVIPEEIKSVKEKYPDLTREQCLKISDYQVSTPTSTVNTNPWREKIDSEIEKKEYSYSEIAELAEKNPTAYATIASKAEKGEIKILND